MDIRITASTPQAAIAEVVRFYEREVGRLHRAAGLTTGRQKKDDLVLARYAQRQADWWKGVTVEAP